MTDNPEGKTCADCYFGTVIPNDLANLSCEGMPPQLVILPGAQPRPTYVHPCVKKTMRACALFRLDTPPAPEDGDACPA